jgi:murein DD-endopeptidase MepM/ murein hydrolase activator NlpD
VIRLPVFALALLLPLSAAALELKGQAIQGGLLYGEVAPGSRVQLDGTAVRTDPQGRFVVGFGREAPSSASLTVTGPDGGSETRALTVVQRDYEIQRIDDLPQKMVTPPESVWDRIKADAAKVAAARAHDSDQPHFAGPFDWPATGIVSGVYGSQRILNGTPRQPHYGVDIAAPEGTPVLAPAGGIVRLAETDLYYTGGTIILDHGYGVSSTFLHMASVEVAVGERVERGGRLGTVGSTGRSTGAHLDWRINWFEERIDPQLVVAEPMPEPAQ